MYARLVENQISTALQHTRVVLIHGPRQSGKTTLARQLVRNSMRYFNLEDPTDWQAASTDPVGFVRTLDRAVIDEIQRSPELLLAIKSSVDSDQRAGRFIFTGSANLMTVPRVSDSFARRMRMVQLLPLAQCEVFDRKSNFLDLAFSGQTMLDSDKCLLGEDLVELVLRGGYPEPIRLESVPDGRYGIKTTLKRLSRRTFEKSVKYVNYLNYDRSCGCLPNFRQIWLISVK